jgi:hypothetical protein
MSTEKVKKLTTDQRIKQDKPIEVYENKRAGWVWKVWKKYQRPDLEAKNPYARWFCSVKSPFTYDGYDMGDTYISDIKMGGGVLTFKEE